MHACCVAHSFPFLNPRLARLLPPRLAPRGGFRLRGPPWAKVTDAHHLSVHRYLVSVALRGVHYHLFLPTSKLSAGAAAALHRSQHTIILSPSNNRLLPKKILKKSITMKSLIFLALAITSITAFPIPIPVPISTPNPTLHINLEISPQHPQKDPNTLLPTQADEAVPSQKNLEIDHSSTIPPHLQEINSPDPQQKSLKSSSSDPSTSVSTQSEQQPMNLLVTIDIKSPSPSLPEEENGTHPPSPHHVEYP